MLANHITHIQVFNQEDIAMLIVDFILNLLPQKKTFNAENKNYTFDIKEILGFNTPICDQIFADDPKYKALDMTKPHAMAKIIDIGEGLNSYVIMNSAVIKPDADEEVLNFIFWHENSHGTYNHLPALERAIANGTCAANQCAIDLEISADISGYCCSMNRVGYIHGMKKVREYIPREHVFEDRLMGERIQMIEQFARVMARLS